MAYGFKLDPDTIHPGVSVTDLVDRYFLAYNGARLREACQLIARKVLRDEVTVCLTVSGALTPTGLGYAAIVPLIEAGFVDWIVTTGANLYHDLHRSLGFELFQTSPRVDDVKLRQERIIRIYDVVFEQQVLLRTDAFLYRCMERPEFQHRMSSAEMHYRLGRYAQERERALGTSYRSILTVARAAGVPLYTSSPGDSTIGMNVAALRMAGYKIGFDTEADVNETTSIVYAATLNGGKSAIIILGGGSPKNFALQTEPQLQEILGISERGHDYFVQFTDARADTGGLSGATPSEAITWGKIDPDQLPDTVTCYVDTTIALPILTAYLLENCQPRPLKRLYDRREELLAKLTAVHQYPPPAHRHLEMPDDLV